MDFERACPVVIEDLHVRAKKCIVLLLLEPSIHLCAQLLGFLPLLVVFETRSCCKGIAGAHAALGVLPDPLFELRHELAQLLLVIWDRPLRDDLLDQDAAEHQERPRVFTVDLLLA